MLKGGFWGPGTPVASPPVPGNSLRVQGNLVSFNVMSQDSLGMRQEGTALVHPPPPPPPEQK